MKTQFNGLKFPTRKKPPSSNITSNLSSSLKLELGEFYTFFVGSAKNLHLVNFRRPGITIPSASPSLSFQVFLCTTSVAKSFKFQLIWNSGKESRTRERNAFPRNPENIRGSANPPTSRQTGGAGMWGMGALRMLCEQVKSVHHHRYESLAEQEYRQYLMAPPKGMEKDERARQRQSIVLADKSKQ